jgi:hypothetical protein
MDSVPASGGGSALGALAWLILLVAVLLSLVLALVSRRLYVAAVVRLQGHSRVRSSNSEPAATVPSSLRIVVDDLADRTGPRADDALLKLRRRLLVLQALGDIVFWGGFLVLAFFGPALMQALGHFIRTGDSDLVFTVLRMMTLTFDRDFSLSGIWVSTVFIVGWLVVPPLVLCVGQTAARRSHVYIPVALFAMGSLVETSRVTLSSGPVLLMMAIGVIGIGVVLLRDPRVRGAASPLVVALATGLLACTLPVLLVEEWSGNASDAEVPFSATVALVQVAFLLVIAVSVLGVLYGLAYFYRRKRFSDVQLASAAFWLLTALAVVGMVASALRENPIASWVPAMVALPVWAFVIVFAVGRWRQRLLRKNPPTAGDLLILRVFKRAARSETFIDRLLSFWRFAAPVRLIAGPDLAGASIEPDEFFAFITRRLRERFVRTPTEMRAQVEGLDRQRDPDGRFRVNELFCVEETWRTTVGLLMAQAGVVLFDLREYEPGRAGTRYEMFQLMNLVPVTRVIVLLGRSDDAAAVSAELQQAWLAMSDGSPNRLLAAPALQVCRLRSGSANEVKALFGTLYARSMEGGNEPVANPA